MRLGYCWNYIKTWHTVTYVISLIEYSACASHGIICMLCNKVRSMTVTDSGWKWVYLGPTAYSIHSHLMETRFQWDKMTMIIHNHQGCLVGRLNWLTSLSELQNTLSSQRVLTLGSRRWTLFKIYLRRDMQGCRILHYWSCSVCETFRFKHDKNFSESWVWNLFCEKIDCCVLSHLLNYKSSAVFTNLIHDFHINHWLTFDGSSAGLSN